MRNLTTHDIRMHSGNLQLITSLTYDPVVSDDTLFNNVIQHIEKVKQFQRIRQSTIEKDTDNLAFTLKYFYEGYDDVYPLYFHFQLARMESAILLIGHYEHEYNGLFDELIEENVIPDWKRQLGFESFHLSLR